MNVQDIPNNLNRKPDHDATIGMASWSFINICYDIQ